MKRIIIFSLTQLLIFIAPLSTALAAEPMTAADNEKQYKLGQTEGYAAADSMGSTARWGRLGFVGGFMLGPIGTLTVANFSQTNVHDIPVEGVLRIMHRSQPYQDGFKAGFAKRTERKALNSALIGGFLGMAVVGTCIAMAAGEDAFDFHF